MGVTIMVDQSQEVRRRLDVTKCGKMGYVKKECWSNQKRRERKDPE